MKPMHYSIFTALALTGCVGGISPDVPNVHPGNPQAQQSPVAPIRPTLLAGSRGLVLPVSTNDTAMGHEHHQTTPTNKPAQKPAEHKHEHEQPKKEEKK
jgi:hypothetical protein